MNILITSTGRRTYMVDYFKDALDGRGKVFAANSEMTYALKKADEYVLTPNIYDTTYVDFLLNYCAVNDIQAIISLFDIDLPVLAKNKSLFLEKGIKVIVSDFDFVSVCNDKWKTYQFIINNGFNAPNTFINLTSVKEALDKCELEFPLIIKPRWGMGSLGIFEAENVEELELFYKKTKSAILKSYLRYESAQNIDESIIIQEKIVGEEWGLDVFNDFDGNYLACVPKRKVAMRAGETDIAEVSTNEELVSFGSLISSITTHVANMDVDFFIKDGVKYILEFNCRFGGQYPFSHIAGVDFPRAIVSMLYGETPYEQCFYYENCRGFKDLEVKKV